MSTVKVTLSERIKEWSRTNPKGLREGQVAAGKKYAPRVVSTVQNKLRSKLKSDRTYSRTISSKVYDSGTVVVRSTDTIKRKNWLETKRRNGVKTAGKGTYAWRDGKREAKGLMKSGEYEAEIAKRL